MSYVVVKEKYLGAFKDRPSWSDLFQELICIFIQLLLTCFIVSKILKLIMDKNQNITSQPNLINRFLHYQTLIVLNVKSIDKGSPIEDDVAIINFKSNVCQAPMSKLDINKSYVRFITVHMPPLLLLYRSVKLS